MLKGISLLSSYSLAALITLSHFSCPSKQMAEAPHGSEPGYTANTSLASAGRMTSPRSVHISTLLKNGKVLIAGGMQGDQAYLETAEIYDPQTNTFTPTGKMNAKRVGPVAMLMSNGKVLVTGGINQQGSLSSAEIYDPVTGKFSPTGNMVKAREAHALVQLNNGQILVAGGLDNRRGIAEAELYNPSDGTFKLTGGMKTGRGSVVAAPLPDGRVIVCGGTTDLTNILTSAEIYDPRSGSFTTSVEMNQPRFKFAANVLADGRVLLTGGSVGREWSDRRPTAEVFDAKTGRFSPVPNMNVARFKHTTATANLPDGRILVAGGNSKIEVFDPKTATFRLLQGDFGDEFFFNSATLLPNGKVLVTGGYRAARQGPPVTTADAWLITI